MQLSRSAGRRRADAGSGKCEDGGGGDDPIPCTYAKALAYSQSTIRVPWLIDVLGLAFGLTLEPVVVPADPSERSAASLTDLDLGISCCCLSAQLLGLLASRDVVAREDGSRSSLSPEITVTMAAKLLDATCELLADATINNIDAFEVATLAEQRRMKKRLETARETANACNAVLQGLTSLTLSEVRLAGHILILNLLDL